MSERLEPVAYAGVDWATQKHDVCVVDVKGGVVAERAFAADAGGLAAMADWLVLHGGAPPERIAVGIEVPHGAVVETLLERGFAVHAINPRQLDRFRDRFSMAGAKDDRRDARVLADSLRTDPRAYRRLASDEPDVIELREWSRMAEELSREDTVLCNRARQQLLRFFPQVLELGEDPGESFILALLEEVPTPAHAHKRRRSTIDQLLRDHRIRRWKADEVLAILRKPALTVAPGTVEAATGHLKQLAARIRLVRRQLEECNAMLDAICRRLGAADEQVQGRKNEPRDVEILLSLPGVGRIIAASLLAEASRPLRDRDYQALRTLAGIAPVTSRSGKSRVVFMRRSCSQRLRNALYHAARVAAQYDPLWKARYAALRARGHSHGRACRGVADSLLRVAIAMLRSRALYDPARRRAKEAA
jgi:transposase